MHERFGAFAGAESNVLATATELKDRGWKTAILHGPVTSRGEENWIRTFPDRFPLPPAGHMVDNVSTALNAFQPDVVYVHKLSDLNAIAALLQGGVPTVRMVHDHDLYCMRSYKYNYLTRRICDRPLSAYCLFPCGAFVTRNHEGGLPVKWVSFMDKLRELELNRRFDRLLVASEFMKAELLRNGFAEGKIEIHAPVPREADYALQSSFSDRNILVYSGQITRGKGVDVLLQALALVTEPFECLIFGDGNHRPHCERLSARLGLEERVRFAGFVPPAEIALHYADCSVALMSSVWPEPFGAAGLEAMRYGLPVVAFDAGGIKEWLTDGVNGFLVPWMDHVRYAERLQTLLRDKALARRMGERGRQSVAESFSFSKYVDGLETLFTRVSAHSVQTTLT